MERTPNKKQVIELSSFWIGEKEPDSKEVSIFDCEIPNFRLQDDYKSGFYGFHHRLQGTGYAREFARNHQQIIIPVTIGIKIDHEISVSPLKLNQLPDVDFINVDRCAKPLVNFLAEFWYERLMDNGEKPSTMDSIDWRRPSGFMSADESLIFDLLKSEEFKHIKLFVCPMTPIDNKSIHYMMGLFQPKHMIYAVCPSNSDFKIKIQRRNRS